MLPLVLSSDSHVLEPPDLWQTRTDARFRDRAPRIQRVDGADQIVVEAGSGPLWDRLYPERRCAVRGSERFPLRAVSKTWVIAAATTPAST